MTNPAARRPWTRTLMPALALALALPLLTGCGEDEAPAAAAEAGALTIEDPWVRATTGTEDPTMTAAFLVIDNETEEDVTLESATSPAAPMVQIHEMAEVDGETVMREAEHGVLVRAGGGQLLQPGGYHLMLMDLEDELAAGAEVDLALTFSDGTTLEVTAPVKEFTEDGGHYHAPGTGEHEH